MSKLSERRDNAIVRVDYLLHQLQNPIESQPQISRVDDQLRQVNGKDYEPETVAIGPIHRGKDSLMNMEHHKVRYLKQLLQRIERLSIEKCVIKLREIEEQARQCYPQAFHLDRDEFVVMLLLDGCFVIELVRKYWFEDLRDKNDPIFKYDHTLSRIKRDLMLLENQLPFFVLKQLFDMTKSNDPEENIHYLVLVFVVDMLPWTDASKIYSKSDSLYSDDHLLGLIYRSCFSFSSNYFIEKNGDKGNNLVHINSTSELKEAGIRLKRSKGMNLLDATFLEGVLNLPPIQVSDNTESILRNLIAYELCLSNNHPKYVTSYAFLMNCLINSSKDVAILRRHGIISNFLGGDGMICDMFSRLGTNVLISSSFCYFDVFERVNRHCRIRHKMWVTKLRRNYFNSPWSMLSFLGATTLIFFTITQTVFSALSYRDK
ncbi:hypothetical protein C2S53_012432 [Perilla frutescens var. hirtella]|uniref:Uncharacterized protein n=1 Tax=Perilla frutescens var. hirtella TaxID=608512 RepID=A0AAD4PCW1_PERFH|nr:hypothetical protein C2S53_012432 [Perilla frutescens var. hirtella]